MGYEDDLNLYAYVRNDPINSVDPDGRIAQLIVGCALNPACRTAVGSVVGAAAGAGGYAVAQVLQGESITQEGLVTAGTAGAVDGALVANGVHPALSGAVTSAGASIVTDAQHGNFGSAQGTGESLARAGVAAGAGALGGRVGQTGGDIVGSGLANAARNDLTDIAAGHVVGNQLGGAVTGAAVSGATTGVVEPPAERIGGGLGAAAASSMQRSGQSISRDVQTLRRGCVPGSICS